VALESNDRAGLTSPLKRKNKIMYLFHTTNNNSLPVFILVLPFDLKHLAAQAGFRWNNPQQGAWATENISVAASTIKQHFDKIDVAADTVELMYAAGKFLPATYERLLDRAASFQPDRKTKAAIEAATMSDEKIAAIHQALQNLAAVCDGSLRDDMAGFNRNDVEYGHTLANKSQLTRSDAGYGSLLLYKYRGQIGEELYRIIFPEVYAREEAAVEEKAAKKAAKEVARADKAAQKAAPKLHKAGGCCEWSGCTLETCVEARKQDAAEQTTMLVGAADFVEAGEVKETVEAVGEAIKEAARGFISEAVEKLADKAVATYHNDLNAAMNTAMGIPADSMVFIAGDAPLGHTEIRPGAAPKVVLDETQQHRVAVVNLSADQKNADPEIIKLATSLIDCYPQDFDTTVELLRALRKIDEPKKAGSEFLQAAWQSAGYQTK
jgi:hypothetical protein